MVGMVGMKGMLEWKEHWNNPFPSLVKLGKGGVVWFNLQFNRRLNEPPRPRPLGASTPPLHQGEFWNMAIIHN
jgi:hypothetical protein